MNRHLTAGRRAALLEISSRLGINFSDISLLDQALTHTSYANESPYQRILHNERLEFLGDAVLELAASTYLYQHFPHISEGDLTKARSAVVCEAALHRRASEVELGEYILFGHGELISGGKKRPSILADAFEAVIGALYLDQGWETAESYVLRQLHDEFIEVEHGGSIQDFKTVLQEIVQRHPGQRVIYELLSATGPDHAKEFTVSVRINGLAYGVGVGHSKKSAEQNAAKTALKKLQYK